MADFLNFLNLNQTPGEAGNYIWATIYILLIFGGVSVAVIAMNWLERKILAHMQIRLGPMRVGPHGLLQPIADAIKLLIKEDIIPSNADKLVFWMAPVAVVIFSFTVYTVLPFGPAAAVTDMNIGILFLLGVSSLSVLAVIMAGWASGSSYPLLGSLRASAQMVSYEVAMGLVVVSAVLMTSLETGTGTLSMIGIVEAQASQGWFVFKFFPIGLIGFLIFAVAMIAETNRAPFDLPEAESELVAGFHTEYSGFRWSLFFLAEYAAMIAVSSVAVALWLGGWLRPFASFHGPEITIPYLWEGKSGLGAVDFAFAQVPGLAFLGLGLLAFVGFVRMPKHDFFRVQKFGLGGFALALAGIGLLLLVPPVRDAVQNVFWFVLKIAVFMYLFIWYRGTFPRYRFDQLMRIGWKFMIPTGLAVLILTGVLGVRHELWAWLTGLMGARG